MPNNFDFGSMVFNEAVMRERLAEDTYAALKDTIKRGAPLARHIATPVAAAMKEWAIEKGATHFTHWFQPLTGITAENRPRRERRRNTGLFRQGACCWRIGCVELPLRRAEGHVRGTRLHRMGPHGIRFYKGGYAVHTHGVSFI